jgi:hypothetical protein
VEIRPAVGQGVQFLDHLWEVVSQSLLLGVHRWRVVDQEQDVDPAIRRNHNMEVGLHLWSRQGLLQRV